MSVTNFVNGVIELVKPYFRSPDLPSKIIFDVTRELQALPFKVKADNLCEQPVNDNVKLLSRMRTGNEIPLIIFTEDITCSGQSATSGCAYM